MTLDDALADAISRGLDDLTVRVSAYGADLKTPAQWQAIAKYRGRVYGPWGVGVAADIGEACRLALAPEPPKLTGGLFD